MSIDLTAEQERAIRERSVQRRKRIVGNVAANHAEAEQWDLDFWQKQGPAMRLSALVDLREELDRIPDRNKAFDNE